MADLIIDIFDPRLDWILPDRTEPGLPDRPSFVHPVTGHTVRVDVLTRANDPLRQVLTEWWRLTETSAPGALMRDEEEVLELRWTYRYEMRHLLELCDFTTEHELSDFTNSPPTYGREQIWIAKR
jgi:hypothetical protein